MRSNVRFHAQSEPRGLLSLMMWRSKRNARGLGTQVWQQLYERAAQNSVDDPFGVVDDRRSFGAAVGGHFWTRNGSCSALSNNVLFKLKAILH